MAQYTLENNTNLFMSIDSRFGDDIVLTKFRGEEQISSCYVYQLEVVSKRINLPFADIMGTNVTISFLWDESVQYFNGIVNLFRQKMTHLAGTNDEYTVYEMQIVPAVWFLTQNSYCRIFQGVTYAQIISDILASYKIDARFDLLDQGKPVRDICVQYNESDFDFINRLMEEEGVFYFFAQEKGKHTLLITDKTEAFLKTAQEPLDYIGPHETDVNTLGLTHLEVQSQVVPAGAAVDDFNFTAPGNDLLAQVGGHGLGGVKYHYPGNYWDFTQKDGEYIAKIRLEQHEVESLRVTGRSNLPFITHGHGFRVKEHPRADLNETPWILEKVVHQAELAENLTDFRAGEGAKKRPIVYQNSFKGFNGEFNYRPPLKTPRPKINSQTALVVGKDNEEVWADEYGRVKVHFHWDTQNEANDQSSCWIRVMQPWTGNGWGVHFIPRIGQEVVVQFLNGNPDHPLITGCVYNAANLPPYLPDHPTVSTIKTNSSPGGEGFNEIRFEDKKEEEQLFIHAQRDMDTVVEANQTVTLNKGDRTVLLHEGNYSRTLEKGDETIDIQAGNRTTSVKGGDEMHQNEQNFTHEIQKNDVRKVGGDQTESIQGNLTQEISGNATQKIGGNLTQEINGNYSAKVMGNAQLQIQGNLQITVTGSVTLSATSGYTLNSSSNVTVSAASGISMSGGTSVSVSSGATLSLSGGATAQLSGSGMCQITGGMVMINS